MTNKTETRGRLADLATRAAAHQQMVAAISQAVHATLPTVIEDILREQYGGGKVCFYMPKVPRAARGEKKQKVEALLEAGLPHRVIAARARCSLRYVGQVQSQVRERDSQRTGTNGG